MAYGADIHTQSPSTLPCRRPHSLNRKDTSACFTQLSQNSLAGTMKSLISCALALTLLSRATNAQRYGFNPDVLFDNADDFIGLYWLITMCVTNM